MSRRLRLAGTAAPCWHILRQAQDEDCFSIHTLLILSLSKDASV